MGCIDQQKGHRMWRKIWPFVLTAALAVIISFILLKKRGEKDEKISDPIPDQAIQLPAKQEEAIVIKESCPPPREVVKEVVQEVPIPVEKIVYRDRIIYRDRPAERVGCQIDWQTGRASASVPRGKSVICTIDWERKHLDERLVDGGLSLPIDQPLQ